MIIQQQRRTRQLYLLSCTYYSMEWGAGRDFLGCCSARPASELKARSGVVEEV